LGPQPVRREDQVAANLAGLVFSGDESHVESEIGGCGPGCMSIAGVQGQVAVDEVCLALEEGEADEEVKVGDIGPRSLGGGGDEAQFGSRQLVARRRQEPGVESSLGEGAPGGLSGRGAGKEMNAETVQIAGIPAQV